jgi:hypothetical protein
MERQRVCVVLLGVFLAALVSSYSEVAGAQAGDVVSEPPSVTPETPPALTLEVTGPEPLAPDADQARLGSWLEYLADSGRRSRMSDGSYSLFGSAAMMGIGIWAFVKAPPNTELNKGIGLLAISGAGIFMSVGIFQLAMKSEAERRLGRWQEATSSKLTLRELRRFEGEFRSYSAGAERELLMARWTNFGMALTGALILGLTPAASLSRDAETIGYVTGGVALGIGLVGFGFSFRGTPETEHWNSYIQGQSPPKSTKWSASPAVGRKFVGAQIVGQF